MDFTNSKSTEKTLVGKTVCGVNFKVFSQPWVQNKELIELLDVVLPAVAVAVRRGKIKSIFAIQTIVRTSVIFALVVVITPVAVIPNTFLLHHR